MPAAAPPVPSRDTVPALSVSLARAIVAGLVVTGGAALALGEYALLRGVMDYLLPGSLDIWPGSLGAAAAIGLLSGELVCGHLAGERLMAGKRDAYTWALTALVVLFAVIAALLACVREVAAHAAHVAEAVKATQLTVPPELASHPRALTAWLTAQAAQQHEHLSTRVAAADEHSVFEVPVLVLAAVATSLAAAAAAAAVGELVHSLLAIPAGVVALFRRRPAGLQKKHV
jgi:hypothetical protein